MARCVHGILCFISSLLSPGKAGSAFAESAFLLLPPHFSFLDGIVAMNNQGPMHGSSLHFGCIAFSQDAVALDTAVLQALRLSPEKSPLWREAQKRRYPGTVPDNLFFPMLRPEAFHGISFSPPSELSPIRFNPFRFMWNNVKRTVIRIKE